MRRVRPAASAGRAASTAHRSKALSQRGRNGQPTSGRSSRGGAPGNRDDRLVEVVEIRRGCEQEPRVRMARARGRASSTPASSTILPAYITTAWSQSCATTGKSCVTRTSARPKSRHSASSSSRICACTITSSAVVGSSAISTFGPARERHRDRGALAHAARQLVRETRGPRCVGMPTDSSSSPTWARAAAPCATSCELERLDDLRADRTDRVERVHRALEDDRDVDPAVRAHRRLAAGEDVLAVEEDAARRARARRQQAHDRERRGRLPAARLADEPDPLARLEREADALDGVQLAPPSSSNQTCRSSISSSAATAPDPFPPPSRTESRRPSAVARRRRACSARRAGAMPDACRVRAAACRARARRAARGAPRARPRSSGSPASRTPARMSPQSHRSMSPTTTPTTPSSLPACRSWVSDAVDVVRRRLVVLEEEDRAVELDLPRRAHRLHQEPEAAADERRGDRSRRGSPARTGRRGRAGPRRSPRRAARELERLTREGGRLLVARCPRARRRRPSRARPAGGARRGAR